MILHGRYACRAWVVFFGEGFLGFSLKRVLERTGVFLLALLALGLPVVTPHALAVFVIVAFLSALGQPCHRPRRVGLALLLAGGVFLLAPLLRQGSVIRAEQLFLPRHSSADAVYVGSLPASVLDYMSGVFEDAYPDSRRCSPSAPPCWQDAAPVTESQAFSFDDAWHPGKRRARSRMAFYSLPELRGGFVHEAPASWQDGDGPITRTRMPYYVRLLWQEGAVGGTLCWTGTLLWEEGGRYVVQESNQMAVSSCRMVSKTDVGRTVFGMGIDPEKPLGMEFVPARLSAFRDGLFRFLRLSGALAIVLLLTDFAGLLALWPLAVQLVLGWLVMWVHVPGLVLGHYAPLPFGPALRSEIGGRMVAQALLSGDFKTFFALDAPAFLEAPGPILFRALEKLVFGDGFGGTAMVMLLLLPILFRLARTMMDSVSAWLVVLVFVSGLLKGIGFSARLFYGAAAGGAAGPLAVVLFLAGMALCCPGRAEKTRCGGVPAALLMALATLIDPVLLPAAVAVLVLAGRGESLMSRMSAYGGILLLVPLHNLVFSGMPWPDHVPVFLVSMVMPPMAWMVSISHAFHGGMASVQPLMDHVRDMLFWEDGGLAAFWGALRLAVTFGGIWVLLSRRPWLRPMRPAAIGGFAVVVMTLFYTPDIGRFMLGGILNLLVACSVGWHIEVRPVRPRYVKPPHET
ncbi:MAG TPA: hypothetical protein DCW68_03840 [Rhodospirillaceae bacterium]|nr:MAG: hypothetical protein A2018_07025 [Alphaproteobacteria bacterium GWF2_58_20]HAU29226.1 hypothetical protein [Rhodospirillaceae bacterium]